MKLSAKSLVFFYGVTMKRTLKECSTKKNTYFLKRNMFYILLFLTLKGGYFDPPSHPLQGFLQPKI